jgi:hypothetical protein
MNIHRIPHFLRALPQRSAMAAALFLLAAAIPLRSAPEAPDAALERETVDFEGIRIVFPKGEADVVEQLKPALRKFRKERQSMIEAEAKNIADSLSDTEMREMMRKLVSPFLARETVSDQFNGRWALQAVTMQKLADAWLQWSGDISELQLWRRDELGPFQTRPDGSDDAEGFSHRFPQVSFGKNGSHIAVNPPFLVALIGLDITLKLTKETQPLRLDIPLLYKAGESPEQIAKFGREYLGHLPGFIHEEYARGLGLVASLPQWTFENMFLGEMEADFVERRTAAETALADGLARFLLLVQVLKQDGEEKMMKKIPRLFPFGRGGVDTSDHAAILTTLEKLDPLGNVERANVTERIYARNLIALTLLEIARKEATQAPILHKFKKAGVEIPAGGFTMKSFTDAVDAAYGEKGFFAGKVAAKKAETFEQLRKGFARQEEQAKEGVPPAVNPPAAPAAMPGRQSAKFGALTITFPPELKAAVEIVGPEYAKVLATAREAMEALCKKTPPVAAEVADADSAALRAYGIEPDADMLRQLAVMLGGTMEGPHLARWFVSGDRMQIWLKEDILAFVKGGGAVPDFTLAPDGEGITWTVRFALSGNILDSKKMVSSHADALAEVTKRLDAMPHPVYPIVLKRGSLPEKLDDPAAVAAAIRAGERELFGSMRTADQNPEKASGIIASFIPRFGQEQGWFLVAHEVAESAIVNDVIASADRRWFCDGLANWIAIHDVDRRFGAGKGAEVFAKYYDATELRKHAVKVDLLAWPTAEAVEDGSRPDVENPMAHYYFATLVIEKACEGRDAKFVKSWLDEIRQTPLNRANNRTVLAAYRKLTGNDLKDIIGEVVK